MKKSVFIILILMSLLIICPSLVSAGANFTGNPITGPVPLLVQFTDKSTNNPTGWAWYFGLDDWSDHTLTWTQMTPNAGWTARRFHSSVAMPDGSIIIMGGYCPSGEYGSMYLNDVWRSTNNGATWTLMTPNAAWSARSGHSTVVLPDGSIVLMGGSGASSFYHDVWRSTDNGATWAPMTTNAGWSARSSHSSVVLPDGSIVLMGGGYPAYKNDVWRSADNGATWAPMTLNAGWTARRFHSSVALPDGSIVLMGGMDGLTAGDNTNDVWRSTTNGGTWTQMTAGAGWSKRSCHTSVVMPDGSIVLMGGIGNSDVLTHDVWRSTTNGATWTSMTTNAGWLARWGHSSASMRDGSIVLTGGTGAGGFYNDVWRLITAVSSKQNPSRGYNLTGTFTVTLQAYNTTGYSTIQKIGYITVTIPSTISSMFPSSGIPGKIYLLDITGTNFDPHLSTISFSGNGVTVGSYSARTTTRIVCPITISRDSAPGARTVTVTNPRSRSTATATFTIISSSKKPTITKISPAWGYNSRTLPVTITGTNFRKHPTVKLGKGTVSMTGAVKKVTNTTIICNLPLAGARAGKYNLTVKNIDGTLATKTDFFTVLAAGRKPVITTITPKYGLNGRNTPVTIAGFNFRRGAVVQMIKERTIKNAAIRSIASKKIVCTLPTNGATPGLWNVKVTNTDGTTTTMISAFTVKRTTTRDKNDTSQGDRVVGISPVSVPHLSGHTLTEYVLVPVF